MLILCVLMGLWLGLQSATHAQEPEPECPQQCLASYLPDAKLEPTESNELYRACCGDVLAAEPWSTRLHRAKARGGWRALQSLETRLQRTAAAPDPTPERVAPEEAARGPAMTLAASARLGRAVCHLVAVAARETDHCDQLQSPLPECDALASELLVHAERVLLAGKQAESPLRRSRWVGDAAAARCLRAVDAALWGGAPASKDRLPLGREQRLDALLAQRVVGVHSLFELSSQFYSAAPNQAPVALPTAQFLYEGVHFTLALAPRERAVVVESWSTASAAPARAPVHWSFRDTSPSSVLFAPEPTGCARLRLAVPRAQDVSVWLDGRLQPLDDWRQALWESTPNARPHGSRNDGTTAEPDTLFVPLTLSRQPHRIDILAATNSGPRLLTHQNIDPKDLPDGLDCLELNLDLSEHVQSILLPVELEPTCADAGVSQEHVHGQVLTYLRGSLGASAVRDFREWQRALSGLRAFRQATESKYYADDRQGSRGERDVSHQTEGLHAELARQGFSEAFGGYLSCFRDSTHAGWHFAFSAQRVALSAILRTAGTRGRSMQGVLRVARLTVDGRDQLFEGIRAPLADLLATAQPDQSSPAGSSPSALRITNHSRSPWLYEPLWADVEKAGEEFADAQLHVGVRRLPDAEAGSLCRRLERLHRLESGASHFDPHLVPDAFPEQLLLARNPTSAGGRFSGSVPRGGHYLLTARLAPSDSSPLDPVVRPDTATCVRVREPQPNLWLQSSLATAWPGQLPPSVAGSLRTLGLRAGLRLGRSSWLTWGGQIGLGVTWRTGQLPSRWDVGSVPQEQDTEHAAPHFETPTAWQKYAVSAGASAEASWRLGRARAWSRFLAAPSLLLVVVPEDSSEGSELLRQELLGAGNRGELHVAGDVSTHLQIGVGMTIAGETEVSVFGGLVGAEWLHWIERRHTPSVANADAGLRWEVGLEVSP